MIKGLNTIQESWDTFKSQVIPKNAPDIQKTEMQKSFYSGSWAALEVMVRISNDDISEDTGAQIFENLRQECIMFFEQKGFINDGK